MKIFGLSKKPTPTRPDLERNVRIAVKRHHEAGKNLKHLRVLFPLGVAFFILGWMIQHFMPGDDVRQDTLWVIGLLMICVKVKDVGVCLVRGHQISNRLRDLDKFNISLQDVVENGTPEDALTQSERIDLESIVSHGKFKG